MRSGKEYLLKLDTPPTITPKNGDLAKIYDWSGGESFTVIAIVYAQSSWASSAHIRATKNNGYGAGNLQDSRLGYRDINDQSESREILGITELLDQESHSEGEP